jgi:hypothetical protein
VSSLEHPTPRRVETVTEKQIRWEVSGLLYAAIAELRIGDPDNRVLTLIDSAAESIREARGLPPKDGS